jgi:hypothetical protein
MAYGRRGVYLHAPILHPEKIPRKKSKAQDGLKGPHYYSYPAVVDSNLKG